MSPLSELRASSIALQEAAVAFATALRDADSETFAKQMDESLAQQQSIIEHIESGQHPRTIIPDEQFSKWIEAVLGASKTLHALGSSLRDMAHKVAVRGPNRRDPIKYMRVCGTAKNSLEQLFSPMNQCCNQLWEFDRSVRIYPPEPPMADDAVAALEGAINRPLMALNDLFTGKAFARPLDECCEVSTYSLARIQQIVGQYQFSMPGKDPDTWEFALLNLAKRIVEGVALFARMHDRHTLGPLEGLRDELRQAARDLESYRVLGGKATARKSSTAKPESDFRIAKWSDLAIGIDEHSIFAFNPPPKPGAKLRKGEGVLLDLPANRWREVFKSASQSKDGRTVTRGELARICNLLPPPGDRSIASPANPRKVGEGQSYSDRLATKKGASKLFTDALAELRRVLKEAVSGPSTTKVVLVLRDEKVDLGFVVRCLIDVGNRHWSFGEPDSN